MAGIPPANQDTTFTAFARSVLGQRFDSVRWNTAREKAHETYRECQRQAKADSDAEAARRRARGKL